MKLDLSSQIDVKRAETYLKKLIEQGAKVDIKKHVTPRTGQQNRYFHVACKILSDYSGYTIEEIKIIIKDQLEFMTYQKGGHKFYRSSADLNKEEFTALVDHTRNFGDEHGAYIPTPEEYFEKQFYIEKEIGI